MDAAPQRSIVSAALPAASFFLACLLFGTLWFDYRDYWLDDAFITFRYSHHLATGLGPVFNPGEHVEGYTSFLWMLLASLPFAFASSQAALACYKGFALLAAFFVLARVWTFPGPDGPRRRYVVLLLATQPVFVLNFGDGMETPLFIALMVECLRSLQRSPGPGSGAICGGLTAALVLTRPESLPLLVALPALVALAHRGAGADLRGWLRGFALAGGLPVLAHLAWRIGYYGEPLPNTFYAKATGGLLTRLSGGLRDIGRFFFVNPWSRPVALWVFAAFAGLASRRLAPGMRPATARWLGALWLMIAFRVSFDLWSGSDTMGRHRFLAPAIVPLAILADEGARAAWRGAGRGVVVAFFCVAIFFNLSGHRIHAATIAFYQHGLERAHIALGEWLRERHPAGALVAIADAGAVPYFSELQTIDLWGLNDATIAHMPGEYGSKEGMADYVLGRNPDVVVLWNKRPFAAGGEGRVIGGQPLDHAIASHPRFAPRYRFVREFVFRNQRGDFPGYYLDVFERRDEGDEGDADR